MNYFTADLHFQSEDFLKDWFLPFDDVETYVRTVIDNINNRCTSSDKLYVVGDFIRILDRDIDPNYMRNLELVQQLHPETYLILGNNEERLIKSEFNNDYDAFFYVVEKSGFKGVSSFKSVSMRGKDFNLVHNPENANPDLMTLHGHLHYMTGYTRRGINVSIFQNWLYPMSEDMVFSRINDFYHFHQGYDFVYNKGFDEEFWKSYSL